MQTPHIRDAAAFRRELEAALASDRCPKCHRFFANKKLVYLSLHAIEFGVMCVGEGRVWKVEIPWCGFCEKEPEQSGCIHEQISASAITVEPVGNFKDTPCDIFEATHVVHVDGSVYEIAEKYGVGPGRELAPPSRGGFGVITTGRRLVTMYAASGYLRRTKC